MFFPYFFRKISISFLFRNLIKYIQYAINYFVVPYIYL